MSNKPRRLYVGMTSALIKRVFQHKNKLYPDSFTARYEFDTLVWYEEHAGFASARAREIEIKGWRREKKLKLILAENPDSGGLEPGVAGRSGMEARAGARPRLKRRSQP